MVMDLHAVSLNKLGRQLPFDNLTWAMNVMLMGSVRGRPMYPKSAIFMSNDLSDQIGPS